MHLQIINRNTFQVMGTLTRITPEIENVEGVIVTHWHSDCMGGLNEIHDAGIKSYSHKLTREIA